MHFTFIFPDSHSDGIPDYYYVGDGLFKLPSIEHDLIDIKSVDS